jgi:hypothetical protein
MSLFSNGLPHTPLTEEEMFKIIQDIIPKIVEEAAKIFYIPFEIHLSISTGLVVIVLLATVLLVWVYRS